MIVLENHAPAAPLDVTSLIRRQRLSAADRKELDAAVAKVTDLLDQIRESEPGTGHRRSFLSIAADQAEAAYAADPSRENREKLNSAVARNASAEASYPAINRAANLALRTTIDSLQPVAERVLDAVAADLETEGSKRREEIVKADAVFGTCGDCAEFDRRLQRTRDVLADERVTIRQKGASLAWLADKGFAVNPYTAA
jgi:hypothetical protein